MDVIYPDSRRAVDHRTHMGKAPLALRLVLDEEVEVDAHSRDQKPGGTLVFADGVNKAFHVESIPTVLVLDKSGKIAYRTQGFAPDGFTDLASAAITKASSSAP